MHKPFNFDQLVPRRHTGSYKWDTIPEDAIPLWVADMDFEVAPAIKKALAQRVEHGVFGYTSIDDSYYDAIISGSAVAISGSSTVTGYSTPRVSCRPSAAPSKP